MKKYLEIYPKTRKNHGNIMEFCQTEKVGTLLLRRRVCLLHGTVGKQTPPEQTPVKSLPSHNFICGR